MYFVGSVDIDKILIVIVAPCVDPVLCLSVEGRVYTEECVAANCRFVTGQENMFKRTAATERVCANTGAALRDRDAAAEPRASIEGAGTDIHYHAAQPERFQTRAVTERFYTDRF